MEEFGSIPEVENVQEADGLTHFMQFGDSLQNWLRKAVIFICYVPGVFGFFWLIGRILKR